MFWVLLGAVRFNKNLKIKLYIFVILESDTNCSDSLLDIMIFEQSFTDFNGIGNIKNGYQL